MVQIKAFADDKINVTERLEFLGGKLFSPFLKMFSKGFFFVKSWDHVECDKSLPDYPIMMKEAFENILGNGKCWQPAFSQNVFQVLVWQTVNPFPNKPLF